MTNKLDEFLKMEDIILNEEVQDWITKAQRVIKLQEHARKETLIGGNHLAVYLINKIGCGFESWSHEEALEALSNDLNDYEVWCCWKQIRIAQTVETEINKILED